MEKYNIIAIVLSIILIGLVQSASVPEASGKEKTPESIGHIGPCIDDNSCNNGRCVNLTCKCDKGYLTVNTISWCGYKQKDKLVAFLLSILIGSTGADWFYLSSGSAAYIVAGVFKLLTLGGFGVWYTVDWIRLLVDHFKDGNGYELKAW